MPIDFFGAGVLFATPSFDASGNAIALPSPVQFGIVQDVTIDDEGEIKELYGALQYPVDIGRGKSKIMIKCKQAQFSAELFNSVYYGQSLVGNAYQAVYADGVGTVVPGTAGATSIHITPTAPTGGTSMFLADLGVQDGNGIPFTRVASGPTAGQYTLSPTAPTAGTTGATYTFSSVDVGRTVFINYNWGNVTNPAGQQSLNVYNLPMGQVPVFSAQFFVTRRGQTMWRKFPNCVATKLSMDFKNDDFTIPDLEIQAFADSNNVAQYYSFTV